MNNTPSSTFNSTDLVLQLTGGDRDGQVLPVTTQKCLLSSLITDKAEAEKYRCAIFRGEKGVAFRSYSELVLVNGAKTSVQWLSQGDSIQLTPEMKVVVKQLGALTTKPIPVSPAATATNPPLPKARQEEHTIALGAGILPPSSATASHAPTEGTVSQSKPAPASAQSALGALNSLSAEVSNTEAIASSTVAIEANGNVNQRVDNLSSELSSLVDKASELSPATDASTSQVEPPVTEPLREKQLPEASASIQDFLDKALASSGGAAAVTPETPVAPIQHAPSIDPVTAARSAAAIETPSESPSPSVAAKLRKEEVTSSLNRLLQGTAHIPAEQELSAPPAVISEVESPAVPVPATPVPAIPVPATPTSASPPVAIPPAAPQTSESEVSRAQSLEFLKSLGIDAAELGLSEKTPAAPNTNPTGQSVDLDASPESTSPVTLPTADEIIASFSADNAAPTAAGVEQATEQEIVEAVVSAPVPVKAKAESVADVLARMQNAGSLDSFDMDGPEETTQEPAAAPVEFVVPEPAASATETKPKEGDEDSSVEDYMSQLLNRMRGETDSDSVEDDEKNSEVSGSSPQKEAEKIEISVPAEPELVQETLTAEEFVPKSKAVRMESFDSLREIANNSNRLAIQDHLANQRKVSTATKLQLALISLGFGIVFFAMSCLFSSHISIGGLFCGVGFLVCGVVFAKFYCDEKKLDDSIVKAQKAKG